MSGIKISVAIPIYNAAKHLDVVFDSLLHQTMAATDFEVICVNDCSTDNSKEVIEKYSKLMDNVVLIDRAQNSGGPVVPRNDAIAAARGEYIHFLDNDDFFGEEALERLYRAAQKNQSDVIFGKYVGVNGRGVAVSMFQKGNIAKADLLADNLLYAIAPHKMFRLAFLREHQFNFDPKATAGNDDQLFVIQCYVAAKVVTVLADYPYYFVTARGDENLSSNFVPAKDWLYVWHRVMAFLDAVVPNENYKRKIKVAALDRLLFGNRFPTFMLTSKTTRAQKAEWLTETKRFIDAHTDDQLMQALNPKYHLFWQAVKENDLDKLEKLSVKDTPSKQARTQNMVKLKGANVTAYKRPSGNAILATTYTKPGQEIQVYATIESWLEVRRIGEDGLSYAAFIQKKDVRYPIKYIVYVMRNRAKALLKRALQKIKN